MARLSKPVKMKTKNLFYNNATTHASGDDQAAHLIDHGFAHDQRQLVELKELLKDLQDGILGAGYVTQLHACAAQRQHRVDVHECGVPVEKQSAPPTPRTSTKSLETTHHGVNRTVP